MGEEAARYLGVSYSRLHQLAREGVAQKVSGHWIFTREELDQYRASEKNKGGRPKDDAKMTMENRTPALAGA